MSLVSHCVIILEVTEPDAHLPSLSFKASKYPDIAANKGKGDPVSVAGSQVAIRGQRGTRTFAIETYSVPFPIDMSLASSKPNSVKNSADSVNSTSSEPPPQPPLALQQRKKPSANPSRPEPAHALNNGQEQKKSHPAPAAPSTDNNGKSPSPTGEDKKKSPSAPPPGLEHVVPTSLPQPPQPPPPLSVVTNVNPNNVAPPPSSGWTQQLSKKSKRSAAAGGGGGESATAHSDELLTKTIEHLSSSTTTAAPHQMDTKNFVSGNPFVELTKGILHLHKDNEVASGSGSSAADGPRSEMLCMLSVPSSIECRDLIQFVAPFQQDLEHIKIIRDTLPNQYMALLKFKSQKRADLFYKENNGSPFNSFEDDICKLAYVSRVETMRSNDFAGLPLSGHTELPTCPVCLERMDESVDGILTVLCNHTFHTACLAKWSDSSCPVCRYVQTPEMVANNHCCECDSTESLWICLICGHVGCGRYVQGHAYKHFCETEHCYAIQPDNNRVWDYVGDTFVHRLLQNKGDGKLVEVGGGGGGGGGRRRRVGGGGGAATRRRRHHRAARRLRTQSLTTNPATTTEQQQQLNWSSEEGERDQVGDGGDDDDDDESDSGDKLTMYEEEEKIDSMQLEFTHLLTSQLDAQRKYFEQKLGTFEQEVKKSTDKMSQQIGELEKQREESQAKIQHLQVENDKLVKNGIKLTKKIESLTTQLENETTTNGCLRQDRDQWMKLIKESEEKLKRQDGEIVELKEQVRDLMLYVEFGNKIQGSELKDEIQDGQVSLPSGGAGAGEGGSGKGAGAGGRGKARRKH